MTVRERRTSVGVETKTVRGVVANFDEEITTIREG
jgi:hypothetical protein